MKLKAREKARKTAKTSQPLEAPSPAERTLDQTITTQFNTLLYSTLQNMLESAHTAQDFTFTSVSDVIRAALQAYQEGMPLTELVDKGPKKTLTLRLDNSLRDFYDTLPTRMKTRLLERAVRTFLKTKV